ncbi:hypothetical protein [Bradyrhizobium acaciae]|uniref:hypothetical protein n=1 Tax=Bradyrhizobium acaciae TaxID=2683706 RepID=UPI001E5C914C|nr:hypothetical protein [Bradyrhizobium acaciae]MCC8977593.1 hypothetical protein [Bradyrhizobium acaciae]
MTKGRQRAKANNLADPIFKVIARHRDVSKDYDDAGAIWSKFISGPEYEAAGKIVDKKHAPLERQTKLLMRSKPTTMAGTIALTRYVAGLRLWQMPNEEDWYASFLGGLADVLGAIASEAAIRQVRS